MTQHKTYEYEERAFLEEADFSRVKAGLDRMAQTVKTDNKTSYFFVLPEVNVSIAASADKTVVKYKGGQLGRGNGFEEREFPIGAGALPEALKLFSSLLRLKPQVSEQFRLNYDMGNGVEVALKYTHMWGFHLELEKVFTVADDVDKGKLHEEARQELKALADKLGIRFITDEEMEAFKEQCKQEINRGAYTPDAFRAKYGSLFTNS